MSALIYLDHAATTQPDPQVVHAMQEAMESAWVNPSSACAAAGSARRELRLARQAVAGMLNAEPQEIVDMLLYLASPKGAFITGINILMDGGRNLL